MDAPAAPDGLLTWPDLFDRPRPEADSTLRYGRKVNQLVDLWLPIAPSLRPVVLMIHGGCWQSDVADRRIMSWIAADLRRRGIAVWNVEYRGVDRPGGGYPGTFRDVAAAAQSLHGHARHYGLDTRRIVAIGHSAGGHLALWLAGRHRLPAASPLRSRDPLPIHFAISLGGLPDLEQAARPPGSGCGTEVIAQLTGGRFADTSVPRLAPLGVPQLLINGREDRIIPAAYAADYAARMRAAGDKVEVRMVERTGHVELVAPESAAWAEAAAAIEQAFVR